MTQSTVEHDINPLSNPTPALKIGETGDTVVYIFPSGNACVKKGKKNADKLSQVPTAKPDKWVYAASAKPAGKSQLNVVERAYPKPPKPPQTPTPAPKAIGDRLVQSGLITAIQLQVALYDQQSMNLDLDEVLVARGWIDKTTLDRFFSA